MKPIRTLTPLFLSTALFATDGMNMDGYGPISTALGGTGSAFDNGSAAMMSNPATLGLELGAGSMELQVALGMLGPSVSAKNSGMEASSSSDQFIMPAIGFLSKHEDLLWGVGIFSQGGMGCEYAADSFMAAGRNEVTRSEIGIGRLLAPINWTVNEDLHLAATFDYVWAGMDLQMNMTGAQFMSGFLPPSQALGSARGTMINSLMGMMGAAPGQISGINTVRFDFSDDSDFTGKAQGNGYAGKLGVHYVINDQWQIGASYHSPTYMSDLKTSSGDMYMNVNINGMGAVEVPVSGEIVIDDFQWPSQYQCGAACAVNSQWFVAADIKVINWSETMEAFDMGFVADSVQSNPMAVGFSGQQMDLSMKQEWENQVVIALGTAWQANEAWVVRAGFHHTENPIPNEYINALFPAIVEKHYSVGCGYTLAAGDQVDVSVTYAPEVEATNSQTQTASTHSQTNVQLAYTFRF